MPRLSDQPSPSIQEASRSSRISKNNQRARAGFEEKCEFQKDLVRTGGLWDSTTFVAPLLPKEDSVSREASGGTGELPATAPGDRVRWEDCAPEKSMSIGKSVYLLDTCSLGRNAEDVANWLSEYGACAELAVFKALPIIGTIMHPIAISALFGLQCFQVLFLCLHDWIPLGTLNDVKAVRAANSGGKLLLGTLVSVVPFAFGLAASAYYLRGNYPHWLLWYLGVSCALLFLGELQAWWIPCFLRPDPVRVARYQTMFGNTHAFLPARNGIRPNTLHVTLHIVTLTTLVLTAQQGWPKC